ncbi:MAG: alpha/beta hydrolase [Anaerolineales bacterium]
MTSKTGAVIRIVLRAQRLAQKSATIDGVRRMSKITERVFAVPKDVRHEKITAGEITYEWLIPRTVASPLIFFHIHGGGFVFPLYDPERYTTAYLARLAGARAFLVHYRLAPENPFPAAVEDCAAAYRRLIYEEHIKPGQVVFTGESAGGNLVITTLLALRESGDRLPAGAASICPVMDFEGKGTFHSQDDVMVHPEFAMRQFDAYRGGTDPHHPLLSPLYADLKGLPPMLVQAGEHEILRSGAELFAESARRSGVPVTLHIYPGMWHFWHMFVPYLPEAREAMDEISRFGLSCMR